MTNPTDLRELMGRATPGPWRWNVNATTKSVEIEGGRPTFDKTVMDFARWGLNRAQPRFNGALVDGEEGFNILYRLSDRKDWTAPFAGRTHHADWCANVTHPDAALIVAAVNALPALLDELDAVRRERDGCRADMTQSHRECERMVAQVHEFRLRANAAEAKLERVRACQRLWHAPTDTLEPDPDGPYMLAAEVMAAAGEG